MIYITIFVFMYMLSKIYPFLKKGVDLYRGYKNIVDPDHMYGHLYTIRTMFSIFWTFLKKKRHSSSHEKFNRDYIKISYTYKEKPYYYLLKVKRGVTPLLKIEDEQGNDIESSIMPYLGPNLDCHNIKLTPKDFGYKKIVATTVFDTTSVFEENDPISF